MLEAMSMTPVHQLDASTTSLNSVSHVEKSPLLFDSDEDNDDSEPETLPRIVFKDDVNAKSEVDIKDEKVVKNLRTTLAGVPPPPKFTIPQFSASEMLDMYQKNAPESLAFLDDLSKIDDVAIGNEMKAIEYPLAMKCPYYGIHYNRGQISVDLESLCEKYRARYVGCETSSTVIDKTKSVAEQLTASAKKKARKHPWNYSPGRRLSHLAKRRQIFTSASIARGNAGAGNKSKSSLGQGDNRRMIFIDKKKPLSSNFSSQSARSKLLNKCTILNNPSTSNATLSLASNSSLPSISNMPTLKRALFQSPDCSSKDVPRRSGGEPSEGAKETPRTDKNKARRALFSSGTKKEKTPLKKTPLKKTPRKGSAAARRTPHKATPTSSRKKTPRKSLFADPDSRHGLSSRDLFNVNGKRLRPADNETSAKPISLSDGEKKKLLWAVYHCLKEKNINSKNTLYKPCQNYLYRLCSDAWKQTLRNNPANTKILNVSEKMLTIARTNVNAVILKVKNNQSFYSSSQVRNSKLENSSESGDTSLTSVSYPDAGTAPPKPTLRDDSNSVAESFCDRSDRDQSFCGKSDLESSVCGKSEFDTETVCGRSDFDKESSVGGKSECSSIHRLNGDISSSSYQADDDTNTTGSGMFNPRDEGLNSERGESHSTSSGPGTSKEITQILNSEPAAFSTVSTTFSNDNIDPVLNRISTNSDTFDTAPLLKPYTAVSPLVKMSKYAPILEPYTDMYAPVLEPYTDMYTPVLESYTASLTSSLDKPNSNSTRDETHTDKTYLANTKSKKKVKGKLDTNSTIPSSDLHSHTNDQFSSSSSSSSNDYNYTNRSISNDHPNGSNSNECPQANSLPVFTFTSPFLREAKTCKVLINSMNKTNADAPPMLYDEDTLF